VKQPKRSGFGLELLEGEIGYRLRGILETNFDPAGLAVHIKFPLER
jgi:two-component system CheB/CheR fusion protein